MLFLLFFCGCFFFQAEDGIRDAQESRGLGDVYKRQDITYRGKSIADILEMTVDEALAFFQKIPKISQQLLSLIHI